MAEEQLRKYFTKKITHQLVYKDRWGFRGTNFVFADSYTFHDFTVHVTYACDVQSLSVRLEMWGNYQVLAEKAFNGASATSECVTWTVNKLIEIWELMEERLAPYVTNKVMYDRELNRPIKLQD